MAEQQMTAAEAAKLVKREAPVVGEDGTPTGKVKPVALDPREVFAYRDHGDHVIVVTVDGQKLRGEKPKAGK